MTRSGLRLTLFLLLVVFVGVAGWQYFHVELDSVESASEVSQLDGFRDTVHRGVEQARTAQQAYLAEGQGIDTWHTRFTEAVADVTGALENLRVTAAENEAATAALDSADRALKVYDGLDRKIRGFVEAGSLLMAADVVYEDGLKTSSLIVDGVDEAHQLLASPHAAAVESNRLLQHWLTAAAVAGAVLVALLLLPIGRAADVHLAGDLAREQSLGGDSGDRENEWRLDRPVERHASQAPQAPQAPPSPPVVALPPAAAAMEPAPAAARREQPAPGRDDQALAAAALVCTDLARVKDGDQLRDALGRAARVLDATGVIVWIADADGRALKPLLTYGYPEEALRRIPTLPRDADNATAAAWRDGVTHVVEATDAAPGAVAVPILGPQGCTGVLAAEIGHHREAAHSTRAVAQLVAAQLAVLIPADTSDADA